MSLPELTPEQEIEYAIQLGYPLQPPPENVVPDYENGDTIAYQLYITAGVCFTLMIIFTVFRVLNVSVFKRKTYLLDEGTISTCPLSGACACEERRGLTGTPLVQPFSY
jgi:hypothetical protein